MGSVKIATIRTKYTEYVTLVGGRSSAARFDALREQQCVSLTEAIAWQKEPDHDDVTAVLTTLSSPSDVWTDAQQARIADALFSVMDGTTHIDKKRKNADGQKDAFLHKYTNAAMWRIIDTQDIDNVLKHGARYMVESLKMRPPDQLTIRDFVAMALTARDTKVEPFAAYGHVQKLRELVATCRKALPGPTGPDYYPDDPKVFMAAYPGAFGEDTPIECTLSDTALAIRKEQTAARSTHGSLNPKRLSAKGSSVAIDAKTHTPLESIGKYMLGQMLAQRASCVPGLEMLVQRDVRSPEGSPRPPPEAQRPETALAIADGTTGKCDANGTAGANSGNLVGDL